MREAVRLRDALAVATARFRDNEIETPELDARLLLEKLLGYSHAQMISNVDEIVPQDILANFQEQVEARISGKPVHRILGEREFFGRVFQLNDATLIPRPDTEILVETVLTEFSQKNGPFDVLEIGTGSGAIAVSLACELSQPNIVATDISKEAMAQARHNAEKHGVAEYIAFLQSDLFQTVEGKFDAIVSNPPYIPTSDISELAKEVRQYDPTLALDGGFDGLDFYREILKNAANFLKPDGFVALEIGIGQSDAISGIACEAGFGSVAVKNDLSGVCRVVCVKY